VAARREGEPAHGFGDFTTRGVSAWRDPAAAPARCAVAASSPRPSTVACSRSTRAPARACRDFGATAWISLRDGLRNRPFEFAEFEVTSPPAIINGLIVVGSAIADNNRTDAASGEVRAYDARTGRKVGAGTPCRSAPTIRPTARGRAQDAHRTGAANAWSVIVADTARGLVFVPTSAPSPDYYGGARLGRNDYANSIVALRAARAPSCGTSRPCTTTSGTTTTRPALTGGRHHRWAPRAAVLQATKTGMLFVLDRETGSR
jgi:quinoprotein glucose dehydrogenase